MPFVYVFSKKARTNAIPLSALVTIAIAIAMKPEQAANKTFHITNPSPIPLERISAEILAAVGLKVATFGAAKQSVWLFHKVVQFFSFAFTPLRGFAKQLHYYEYYLMEDRSYDTTNLEALLGPGILSSLQIPHDFIGSMMTQYLRCIETRGVKSIGATKTENTAALHS